MNLDLEYFYNHKIGGTILSAGGAVAGSHADEVVESIYTWHVPPVFIEAFQVLSYAGASTVAFLTIWAILAKKYKAWRKK